MIQLPILLLPDLQVRHLCHIHLCGVDILILAGQKRLVFVQFTGKWSFEYRVEQKAENGKI